MKKILFAILGVVLACVACTNLDEEIYSQMSKEEFLSDDQNLVLYTTRPYTALQKWGSEQSMWTLIMQLSNEVAVPKSNSGAWGETRYGELQKHAIPTSNKLVRKGWDFCFDGIAACNDAIYELERAGDTEFLKKSVQEIKILRAYYYFLAVDCWGMVPFSIDKTQTDYPDTKTRQEMYTWLEQEVKDNMSLLDKQRSSANYGRVTLDMANFLLAKLYLNAEVWTGSAKWKEAAATCKAIMSSGNYSLTPKYEDNFKVNNENCSEAIFAIPYSSIYTREAFYPYVITLNDNLKDIWNIGSTWDGTFMGQPDFLATYESGDLRKSATWLYGQIYDLNGNKVQYQDGVDADRNPVMKDLFLEDINIPEEKYGAGLAKTDGARIIKWPYQSDGSLTNYTVSMDNDFILMRYSDVVLMYVEALIRDNKPGEAAAVPEFAQIRTRAGLAPFTAADSTLDKFFLERAHEMAIEGWEREDLIRFGKYLDPWWAKPDAGQQYMILLPIPELARGANPKLGQNPGYDKK